MSDARQIAVERARVEYTFYLDQQPSTGGLVFRTIDKRFTNGEQVRTVAEVVRSKNHQGLFFALYLRIEADPMLKFLGQFQTPASMRWALNNVFGIR